MWTRGQLKANAKNKLRLFYWNAFVVSMIHALIGGGSSIGTSFTSSMNLSSLESLEDPVFEYTYDMSGTLVAVMIMAAIIAIILSLAFAYFVANPMLVGVKRYYLLSGVQKTPISEIMFAFKKEHYLNVVKTMFLVNLYTGLWTLLFIIPGIIKSYEYSMIPYLLAEDPTLNSKEAFRLSWEMTNGDKAAIFVLELSFLGWSLLAILACGAGVFFLNPYIEATFAELFLALKAKVYYSRQQEVPPMDTMM